MCWSCSISPACAGIGSPLTSRRCSPICAETGRADTGHEPVILLVDDDRAYPLLLARAIRLEGLSLELATAADGRQARAFLSDCFTSGRLPRVVLLDMHLPEENGLELLAWIRSQEAGRALPVLLHSWSPEGELNDPARAAGATGVVTKPDGIAQLRRLARSLGTF